MRGSPSTAERLDGMSCRNGAGHRRSSSRSSLVIAACLALAPAAVAGAQTCLGSADFSAHRVRLQLSADHAPGATTGLASAIAGSSAAFGGAAAGVRLHDRLRETSLRLGGLAGLQRSRVLGRVHPCPVISVELGIGPQSIGGSDFDASSQSVALGLAFGAPITSSNRLRIIVTSALAVEWARLALDGGPEDQVRTDVRGLASLGLGLVFGGRVSLTPRVTLPFATSDAATRLDLAIGVGFWGRE